MSKLDSSAMAIDTRKYVCGGLAAMLAEITVFPMDTAKTRLQLQGKEKQYKGPLNTIRIVLETGGLRNLYKGLSPALLRQAVYGTIKFGLYDSAKDVASMISPNRVTGNGNEFISNVICAVFAGSVSSAVANPTDVVKVRMQAKGTAHSRGLLATFVDIHRREGVAGLWRGVCPNSQRCGVVGGVQLSVYDFALRNLSRSKIVPEGRSCNLLASILAGFLACVASNPFDVVRTRLMAQRRYLKEHGGEIPGQKLYKSSIECLCITVKNEGIGALYKGFSANFGRSGPWNVMFFLLYEEMKKI